MIITSHIVYIAVIIIILLAVLVRLNIDKLYAIKAFAQTNLIPIICIALLLAGFVFYKYILPVEAKRQKNCFRGISPPTLAQLKQMEIMNLKNDWERLASRTKRILPKIPDTNMLKRMDEEWSKYK